MGEEKGGWKMPSDKEVDADLGRALASLSKGMEGLDFAGVSEKAITVEFVTMFGYKPGARAIQRAVEKGNLVDAGEDIFGDGVQLYSITKKENSSK